MTHTLAPVPDATGAWVYVQSWHRIAETYRGDGIDYNLWLVRTSCGLERMWDGSSADCPQDVPGIPDAHDRVCRKCPS